MPTTTKRRLRDNVKSAAIITLLMLSAPLPRNGLPPAPALRTLFAMDPHPRRRAGQNNPRRHDHDRGLVVMEVALFELALLLVMYLIQ